MSSPIVYSDSTKTFSIGDLYEYTSQLKTIRMGDGTIVKLMDEIHPLDKLCIEAHKNPELMSKYRRRRNEYFCLNEKPNINELKCGY